MAYLVESPERPLLAIVGGGRLEPRLKLIDGLLDLVDTLAIGGGLAATFIAAADVSGDVGGDGGTSVDAGGGGRRRKIRRGPGGVGRPRDPPDVLEAARKLLVKARKRGVEVRFFSWTGRSPEERVAIYLGPSCASTSFIASFVLTKPNRQCRSYCSTTVRYNLFPTD